VEYAHAMGNSVGNLKEFWDQWRTTPRIIGGAIWEFKDQGLLKKDSSGKSFYAYGGDYGEKYFDDFTIKGVVASDGRPKAAIYECKHVFQPAECKLVDAATGKVHIKNWHAIANLNRYNVYIQLREDGNIILKKDLPRINLAARHDTIINLKPYLPVLKAGHEYLADIHFVLAQDEAWEKKGYEIAEDQFGLTGLIVVEPVVKNYPKVKSFDNKEWISFGAFTKDNAILFNRFNGGLGFYIVDGKNILDQFLLPHFTRPVTDNDRRGWKAERKLKPWFTNQPKLKTTDIDSSKKGFIRITNTYTMINDSVAVKVIYTVHGDGVIKVDYDLKANPKLPNIPKIGMQMGIAKADTNITYYGRGPLENYIDRRTGFEAGVYNSTIGDFMEPYVVPQENGNRTDVRWMLLADKNKNGLLVVADSLLSMSAWPYTEENIRTARHTNKLKDAGFVTLNIDLKQMGVGGNDSWSDVAAPLEQYRIPAGNYHYSFYLTPFKAGADPGAMARKIKSEHP
jgi:beta-galactosidase